MAVYNKIDPIEDESHQIISSYFLGPKAENYEFFKKSLIEILEAQRDARLDYFPRDGVRTLLAPLNYRQHGIEEFATDQVCIEIRHRRCPGVSSVPQIREENDKCPTAGSESTWPAQYSILVGLVPNVV